jgi:hypothetical protein
MRRYFTIPVFLFLMVSAEFFAGAQTKEETPYEGPVPNPMIRSRRPTNMGPTVGLNTAGYPFRRVEPVPPPPPSPKPLPPTTSVPPLPPTIIRGTGSNIGSVILLFNPLSKRVRQGATFTQDIILDNPRGSGFDTVEVTIKYNPDYLSVTQQKVESLIIPPKFPAAKVFVNEVDAKKGIIRFGVKNSAGNLYYSGPIGTIHWLAKKKIFGTKVTYSFLSETNQPGTYVALQNRDMLGAPGDPTDGIVSGTISIESP